MLDVLHKLVEELSIVFGKKKKKNTTNIEVVETEKAIK